MELSDLGRRHVDVVRSGEVEAVSAPQKAVAVRQDLEDAVTEDVLAVPGMDLEMRSLRGFLSMSVTPMVWARSVSELTSSFFKSLKFM